MVDDGLKSVGLEDLELSIGDEAADLKDLIIFGVEAGHLLRVSFFSLSSCGCDAFCAFGRLQEVLTSQSIQTKGSDERARAIVAMEVGILYVNVSVEEQRAQRADSPGGERERAESEYCFCKEPRVGGVERPLQALWENSKVATF